MTLFTVHGYVISTDLALPALEATNSACDFELRCLSSTPPETPLSGELLASMSSPHGVYRAMRGEYGLWCDYGRLGKVLFSARRVQAWAESREPETVVALFCGSALALRLVASSKLVLHASAVAWDDVAIAIVGSSRAGKTTLAGQCLLAGAELISDDVLRLDLEDGVVRWHAGTRWLRVRDTGRDLLSGWSGHVRRSNGDDRWVALPANALLQGSGTLRAVVFPKLDSERIRPAVRRLTAADALARLLLSPRVRGLKSRELLTEQLELNAELARSAPCFEASLPIGPPYSAKTAAELRSDLLSALTCP